MTNRDEFLAWVRTALYEAELALHNGGSTGRVSYAGSGLLGGTGLRGRVGGQVAVGDEVDVDAGRARVMDNPS